MQTSQVKNGQRSWKDICPRKTWRCQQMWRDAEQIKLDRGTTSQLLGQLLFMRKETTHVCQDKEKRRYSCAVGLNVNWPSHDENSMEIPPKINKRADSAIPSLHTYSKATKILFWKDFCILMFTAASFIIVKAWNQPTINGWSDQENVLYIHSVIHHQKRKSCHLQQHGWNLRALCSGKQSDRGRWNTVGVMHMWINRKEKTREKWVHVQREQIGGCQKLEGRVDAWWRP